MASARERFAEACAALDFEAEVTEYPDGTRTARDAAAAVGCDVAQIVKSLVFMADGAPVLALTSGSNRVDPGALATLVGAEHVRQADADEARGATGYSIGGTPPFGHPTPVATWIDPDLCDHDAVWAAGGTPDTCFPISPDRLVALSVATVGDFTE